MQDVAAPVLLLLPARERFAGLALRPALGRAFGRAERGDASGDQLARVFDVLPRGWPAAAVTRQRDAGDAAGAQWLRADPAYVRPDINGARLLAWGPAFGLTPVDAAELLQPLRPLFGDFGFLLDAPTPTRWYLRLPLGTSLPRFVSPDDALGADLFDNLPQDSEAGGAEGRRWRALLIEAQVVLHNHPLNERRIAAGFAPVNSLWFWGAGALPDRVACSYPAVATDDEVVAAFASLASVDVMPLPAQWPAQDGAFDLRAQRDAAALLGRWIEPAVGAAVTGESRGVVLDFADGFRVRVERRQRWRIWRRPLQVLGPRGGAGA